MNKLISTIFILPLFFISSLTFSETQEIGIAHFKLGMDYEAIQEVIKNNYSEWDVSYNNENFSATQNSYITTGYCMRPKEYGKSIKLILTEGTKGFLSTIESRVFYGVREIEASSDYYSMKEILSDKYGKGKYLKTGTKGLWEAHNFDWIFIKKYSIKLTHEYYLYDDPDNSVTVTMIDRELDKLTQKYKKAEIKKVERELLKKNEVWDIQ